MLARELIFQSSPQAGSLSAYVFLDRTFVLFPLIQNSLDERVFFNHGLSQ
jgi:hypothetical protein